MYWIQEYGNKLGNNNPSWKQYHCDYVSDVLNLPTNTKNGTQITNDKTFDENTNTKAHFGDQCFVLEDGSVYELGYKTDKWIKL